MTVISIGGMGCLAVWGVTFLQLPGASGESFFTPLFDIVKTAATGGNFPLLRRRRLNPSNPLGQSWRLDKLAEDAKPRCSRCGRNIVGKTIYCRVRQHAKLDGFLELRRNSKFV